MNRIFEKIEIKHDLENTMTYSFYSTQNDI